MDRYCAEPPALADVIGLPVYITDTVVRRDLGGGLASVINCRTVNGVIVPQCEIIISIANIVQICKGGSDFAMEMYRRQQMAQMAEMIGVRH